MDDLNDLAYFAAVVRHNGFSAAARATGIEKTRLSRRIAALERVMGVRLLQRSTRRIALTEAGERFYTHCQSTIDSASAAYDSIAALRREPAGMVRLSCPQVMAQSYLAPILPGFMATHPKVKLDVDASDRHVDLIEERFDLALRADAQIEDSVGLVARQLGKVRRVLVASPAFLARYRSPESPQALAELDTLSRPSDAHDGSASWILVDFSGEKTVVNHSPRLVSGDLRMQYEAAVHGLGVALLPEPIVAASVRDGALKHVLPDWTGTMHLVHLLYPSPRGMLPSVRSLIDYLTVHLPASIQERSVVVDR
nr:LysR substrate-binding domain-containing protein [uncultured Cupriavidus sp.]